MSARTLELRGNYCSFASFLLHFCSLAPCTGVRAIHATPEGRNREARRCASCENDLDENLRLSAAPMTSTSRRFRGSVYPRFACPTVRWSARLRPTTAYPAGIALAASWDVDLARRVGEMMGKDARARGVHFVLAPGMNIYRAPMNGRNFEYLGEDPYLASRMAVSLIEGIQSRASSPPRSTSQLTIRNTDAWTTVPTWTSAPCERSIFRLRSRRKGSKVGA